MSFEDEYPDDLPTEESELSDSEPEIPALTSNSVNAPSSKKRSLNNTFPPSSCSKRSRCRANVDQILARMNEDDFDSEAENSTPGRLTSNSTPGRLTSTPKSTYGSRKGRGTSTTPTCASRKVVEKRATSSSDGASALLNNSHFLTSPTTSPDGANVSEALKEITSLLNTVVKRMDRMENELRQQHSTVSSSSASDAGKGIKKKTSVPLVVRVS